MTDIFEVPLPDKDLLDKAIEFVSKKNNLSPINAEILSIYVIGLHCPQVI